MSIFYIHKAALAAPCGSSYCSCWLLLAAPAFCWLLLTAREHGSAAAPRQLRHSSGGTNLGRS